LYHGSAPFRLIPIRLITLYWRKYSNPDPNPIPNPIPNPNLNPIPNPNILGLGELGLGEMGGHLYHMVRLGTKVRGSF